MRSFSYASCSPESRATVCAAGSTATTVDPTSRSTSCASYQSAGLTYQPSRSSSDRRYVLDRGGRPNGIPGSRPISTTRPSNPSSRSVAAQLPPASPPPTITIGLPPSRADIARILPAPGDRLQPRQTDIPPSTCQRLHGLLV